MPSRKDNKNLLYFVIGLWVCICLSAIVFLVVYALNNQLILPTSTPLPFSTNTPISTPSRAAETPPYTPSPTLIPAATQSACHPAYPTVCIPSTGERLSCSQLIEKGISNFPVYDDDPLGYDDDHDGIGCETN